jgi:NTP pyrophosphatase (non-canonical NTP hydrolase)
MTLDEVQERVAQWSSRNFPREAPHGGPRSAIAPEYDVQALLGLVEEVGELAHAILKRSQGIRGVHDEAVADAIGDIVIYLADLCSRSGLSLAECVARAWREVERRDWRIRPTTG